MKTYNEIVTEVEKLDVKTPTPEELAKLHKVDLSVIMAELKKGMAIEKEHTSDPDIAREIALDHIKESPEYYHELEEMEDELEDD